MTTTFHRHWRDVPESAWRWPNFSPAEIAWRGTGKLLINEPALDKLQALRDRLPSPSFCSCCRSAVLANARAGGQSNSRPWKRPMTCNDGCSRRWLAVLVIATSWLTGWATAVLMMAVWHRVRRSSNTAGVSGACGCGAGPAAGGIGGCGNAERLRRDAGAGAEIVSVINARRLACRSQLNGPP
jgi:hypothetical protein